MKVVKILGWFFAGLLVLAVVALGVLAIPGVQRAIVVRALEGDEREVEVERVRLGFGTLSAGRVSLREEGGSYEMEGLDLDFSLGRLLRGRELHLGNVNVRGLYVSLVQPDPNEEPEVPPEEVEPVRTEFPDLLVRFDAGRFRGDGQIQLETEGEDGVQRIRFRVEDDRVLFSRETVSRRDGEPTDEAIEFRAERLEGILVAGGRAGHLFFRTDEPLNVMPVVLLVDGERVVAGNSFLAELEGRQSDEGWDIRAAPLLLTDDRGDGLRLEVDLLNNGERTEIRAALVADIVSLLGQPALAAFDNARAGRMDLTFEAAESDGVFTGNFQGNAWGLVATNSGEELPALEFQADVDGAFPEGVRIRGPLTLRGKSEVSDLAFDIEYKWAELPGVFEGEIESRNIELGDAEAFMGAFQPEAVEEEPEGDALAGVLGAIFGQRPAEAGERDSAPFWSGVVGEIGLRLDEVSYGGRSFLRDISGALGVMEDRLTPDIQGTAYGASFLARGDLRFEDEREIPYQLTGGMELAELDVGQIFREFEPDAEPPVEGKVSVGLDLLAEGLRLDDLLASIAGRFSLTGQEGRFHGLAEDHPLAGYEQALDLLGRAVPAVQRINAVAAYLQEIPFHEIGVAAAWDEDRNIKIENFLLRAADLHLSGSGLIVSRYGVPLLRQPMELELTLGARGELENLLGRTGLLAEEPDPEGYRTFEVPFTLRGMLSDVDASPFYRMLAEALLQPALPFDLPFDLPFGGRREQPEPGEQPEPREGRELEDRARDFLEGLFR